MKITPLDLRNQEFSRTFRGYDTEEVKVFLELVSDEMEYLIRENNGLTDRLRGLDEKINDYRNMEKTLNATLMAAQENAESYFENAKKEADLILENARVESKRIMEEARCEVVTLKEEISRLQKARRHLIKNFKAFLTDQLELLAGQEDMPPDSLMGDEAEGPVESDDALPAPGNEGTFRPTFSFDDDSPDEEEGEDEHESERRGDEDREKEDAATGEQQRG